jgi:hypothetical protein
MDSVEKALGRIEAIVDTIKEDVEEVKDLLEKQNGRVRVLEIENAQSRGGWKLAGVIGGVAGAMASFLPKYWS